MTHSLEELVDMGDRDFHKAVVNDITETTRGQGPFQDPALIRRTLLQLIEWLHLTNARIEERAEDPNCPIDLYQSTVKFRKHLLGAIEVTERRIAWIQGTKERTLKAWRAVLDEVVTAILAGRHDDDILAIKIPAFDGVDRDEMYDLETWHDIRRMKDPARYDKMLAAAA